MFGGEPPTTAASPPGSGAGDGDDHAEIVLTIDPGIGDVEVFRG